MFKRILVPTDGTKRSDKAVAAAVELAAATGGGIVAFHAYPPFFAGAYGTFEAAKEALAEAYEQQQKAQAEQVVAAIEKRARAAGIAFDAVIMESSEVWQAINAVARKKKCDAICMASHGRRGLTAVLLGSETHKVLTHATLPVLVLR